MYASGCPGCPLKYSSHYSITYIRLYNDKGCEPLLLVMAYSKHEWSAYKEWLSSSNCFTWRGESIQYFIKQSKNYRKVRKIHRKIKFFLIYWSCDPSDISRELIWVPTLMLGTTCVCQSLLVIWQHNSEVFVYTWVFLNYSTTCIWQLPAYEIQYIVIQNM